MILCISLVIDMVLLTLKAVRKRNPTECLRFLSMSMIVNAIAYYMLLGLTRTFGYSLLLALVCCAAAKIFVVWFYLQAAEGKGQNIPAYLLTILLSLCPHADPIPGLISEAIQLVYVVYRERREKAEPTESPDTHIRKESDIYLKTIEESYRKNRALMHDLKNHIIVLRSLAERKEYDRLLAYTDSMADAVSENLFPVHSGNIVLDALLADKYHIARRNGIFVEFQTVCYNADLDSGDLCTVIGNLLDNAIAENLREPNPEARYISVVIRSADDDVTIRIRNPLFHVLKVQNGLPASDKPDLEHHGIGLKNVRRVCDKYHGTLLWEDTDGTFTATARLKMT